MKFRGLNSAVLTVIPKKSGKKPKRQKKKQQLEKPQRSRKKSFVVAHLGEERRTKKSLLKD